MKNSQIFWTAASLCALWFAHPQIVALWEFMGVAGKVAILFLIAFWEIWTGFDRWIYDKEYWDAGSKFSILYGIYVSITWLNRTLNKLPRLWP